MRFVRGLRRRRRGNAAAPPPRSDYLWNPADPRSFQALRESGGAVAAAPRPRRQRPVARDDATAERLEPLEPIPGAGIRRSATAAHGGGRGRRVRGGRGGADRGVRRRSRGGALPASPPRRRRRIRARRRRTRRPPAPGRPDGPAVGRHDRRDRGAVPADRAGRLVEGARSAGVVLRGGPALPRPRPLALGQAGRPHFRAAPVAQPHRAAGRARRARGDHAAGRLRGRSRRPAGLLHHGHRSQRDRPADRGGAGPARLPAGREWSCSAWSESAPPG